MLLPVIGGALGAIEGYRRGGLGGALTGGALGAVTPAGLRFAGTALGGRAFAAPLLGALSKAKSAGAAVAGLPGPVAPVTAAGLGGLAAGLGTTFVAPALGAIGGGAAQGIVPTVGKGAGAVSAAQRYTAGEVPSPEYDITGAVPPGGVVRPDGTVEMFDPTGRYQANILYSKQLQDLELEGLRKFSPEIFKAAEARSKTEFARQMAGAKVRANLALANQLTSQGQLGAQAMGQQALGNIGSALTSQYQYS